MTEIQADRPEDGQFQMLEIGGSRMRVFVRVSGSGRRPLLICNGLGQAVEILFPLIAELGDRTIVAFDAIGVGRSATPDRALGISDHTALTREMLTRLGIGDYDVLGISWGGSIAQQLAHDDPVHCRRMVLAIASAGGIGSWWGTPIALSEIFFPMRYFSKEYGNLIGPLMYGGEALWSPTLFRDYAKHSIAPSRAGYFGQVAAMCSWTSLGWLHRITQPTQVISGLLDGLIPAANQLLLAQRIPGAELRVFAAGHLLMYSHRAEIGPVITAFLDRDTDGSSSDAKEV